MTNTEDFAPTHKSVILHLQGKPVACVIDNENNYDDVNDNPTLRAILQDF